MTWIILVAAALGLGALVTLWTSRRGGRATRRLQRGGDHLPSRLSLQARRDKAPASMPRWDAFS